MKPLHGIKVLELARILAGPWIGQLLADLGADVVKVERAGAGDDTRGWGPPFLEGANGENLSAAYYHAANRGKRSVEADFETEEGRALVRKLARHADVVVENFKVGGLEKYGLDAKSLRALNPRLVYCSVTGFGQSGPYAPLAGYDFMIQGMAGVMDLTGFPDGPPMKAGYATADIFCGLYSAVGILAALRRRDETGEGATLDMALMDSQVAVLGYQAINYFVSGIVPKRLGNGHPNIVPYDVFPAADGSIILAVGNNGQFANRTSPRTRAGCATAPSSCPSSAGAPRNSGATTFWRSSESSRCRRGRSTPSPTCSPTRRWSSAASGSTSRHRRPRAARSRPCALPS
jgi:crotonobetainyl-CoA:carnitine CoA-transferase CaiB-like acyl-CoA transferase